MRKIFTFFSFVLIMSLAFQGLAQERTVTGTVTAADDGSPLPGVTVLLKGTTTGTITGNDGTYSLSVPSSGATLVFSFVGYVTQEIAVGNQATINVTLQQEVKRLSEVVVIGYGTTSREAITGSVSEIESAKFQQIPAATFQQALQGNVAGMQVNSLDGQPGSNQQIRIRGIGSITASSTPLYVVDGIPVTSGTIAQTDFGNGGRSSNVMTALNPNDIESVTVLKDASATAIYGSRGANGVILITTKQGKAGQSKINFNSQVGFSDAAYKGLMKPLTAEQYTELFMEGYINRGFTPQEAQDQFDTDYPTPAHTNWIDAITRTGITQQYDLSASGGTDKVTYYASAGYFDQQGYLIGTDFKRFSSRLNLTAKLNDRVTLTNNLTAAYTDENGVTDGTRWANPMYNGYLLAPVIPIKDEEGRYYADHKTFFMGGNNPVGKLSGDDERWMKTTRVIDNISVGYDIIDNLTFKTAWSFDLIGIREFIYRNGRYGDGRRHGGDAQESSTNHLNWIGTQTLEYSRTFGGKHSFNGLLGYEAQKADQRMVYAYAQTFPNPTLRTLASAANPTTTSSTGTMYSFESVFSRFSYDYDRKYFLTVSMRRDGSSRFGVNKRYGNFWSVGAAYQLSKESFMENLGFINDLKLHVSYGITGNASIGNFDHMGLYGFGQDYNGVPGSAPSSIGNPNLTWETQSTMEFGFDFGLFNRINGTVVYYNRENSDLILNRPISMTTGFGSNIQNVADMQNRGLEITLDADVVKTNDLLWTFGGNFSTLKNEIVKLDEPILSDPFRREQGRDYYEFWMWHWAGVDPANGDPLWYTDETESATTNNVSEAERYYDGRSATPSFFGAVNSTLTWKGFTLDAQLTFTWDKWLYDASAWVITGDGRFTPRSTVQRTYYNRWTTPGQEASFPKFIWGGNQSSNQRNQTRYLLDDTYMRLRNLSLSYNIPQKLLSRANMKSLRVYVRGTNLWTWVRDKDLYLDPEQSVSGFVNSVQPNLKTISFGLDFGL
ncbi:MAG: TonB-dependent receptor [Chlorobi bacterium]|nr:TonB-dependent receptor [Chlorobiota bacterium]